LIEILLPDKWREFELIEKRKITHNTSIYRFKLPSPEDTLPLPIGQVKREKLLFLLYFILLCFAFL
jgi:hypothetical protein